VADKGGPVFLNLADVPLPVNLLRVEESALVPQAAAAGGVHGYGALAGSHGESVSGVFGMRHDDRCGW
jgi:hypothetical protein